MATKNPRINVTFEETMTTVLSNLAKKQHKSMAGLVRELVAEALEMREDFYLSKLAEKLDKKGAKIYRHDDVWQ